MHTVPQTLQKKKVEIFTINWDKIIFLFIRETGKLWTQVLEERKPQISNKSVTFIQNIEFMWLHLEYIDRNWPLSTSLSIILYSNVYSYQQQRYSKRTFEICFAYPSYKNALVTNILQKRWLLTHFKYGFLSNTYIDYFKNFITI